MSSNPTVTTAASTSEGWVDVEMTEAENEMEKESAQKEETAVGASNEKVQPPSELDLVFMVDNTGSMGRWIRSAQENVQTIIADIEKVEGTNVRFALVSYRDHPPQDKTFVTKTRDFTSDVAQMQRWVDEMEAGGGGDFPEAVAAALYDASRLSYRPNSTKVLILIADAPPHGLGCSGDGFPNGCPLGHDPIQIVRSMGEDGITIYTVICGNFEGQAFYQGVAQITGGQYIPISSSHLLASVIVGGTQEAISMERLMQDAQEAVQAEEAAEGRELDNDELATRLQQTFEKKKATTIKTQFGGQDLPDFEGSAAHYSTATTLADVRQTKSKDHLSFGLYGGGIDTAPAMRGATFASSRGPSSAPSIKQCKRMVGMSKLRSSKKK